jgi:Nif-specific regulatory protein
MTGRNIINRLILSFDVQDEAMFREFSAKMERIAEGGLADAIDRILQAFSPKDLDITIDRLELDVGEINIHDLEKTHILATLDHLGGNKTRAAKSLGITVKTLYNKLHSYGMIESKEA